MVSSTKVTAIQGIGIKYNQTRISIGQEYASQATRTRTYFHHPHCSIPLLVDLLIEGTSGGSAGSACAGNACWCDWRACVACWSAGHWSAASWGASCRLAGEAGAGQRCAGRTCASAVGWHASGRACRCAGSCSGQASSACARNACWCAYWCTCFACEDAGCGSAGSAGAGQGYAGGTFAGAVGWCTWGRTRRCAGNGSDCAWTACAGLIADCQAGTCLVSRGRAALCLVGLISVRGAGVRVCCAGGGVLLLSCLPCWESSRPLPPRHEVMIQLKSTVEKLIRSARSMGATDEHWNCFVIQSV